jgi:hypothetical protein
VTLALCLLTLLSGLGGSLGVSVLGSAGWILGIAWCLKSDFSGSRSESFLHTNRNVGSWFFLLPYFVPLLMVIGTWNLEFPFSGDHDYHFLKARDAYDYWKSTWILILLGLGLAIQNNWFVQWPKVFIFAFILLFGILTFLKLAGPETFSTRYPGLVYMFSIPLRSLGNRFGLWAENPYNLLRLTQSLAPLIWVLFLRPRVVGRQASLGLCLFGLGFVCNRDVLSLMTSGYLEPWALIFGLTALERAYHWGVSGYRVAMWFAGAAVMSKETALFFIPLVFWVNSEMSFRDRLRGLPLAVTVPWLYFCVRRNFSVSRSFEWVGWADFWNLDRLNIWFQKLHFHWGLVGVPLFGCLSLCLLWSLVKRDRWTLVLTAGIILFSIFFWSDRNSLPWTGYIRFQIFSWALLFAAFCLNLEVFKKTPIYVFSVLLLFQPLRSVRDWSQLRTDSTVFNFFEHEDSPVRLPVSRVHDTIMAMGLDSSLTTLVLSALDQVSSGSLRTFPYAYPKIADRWRIWVPEKVDEACGCRVLDSISVVFQVRNGGLRPSHELGFEECVQKMRQSCSRVEILKNGVFEEAVVGLGLRNYAIY